jgi:hypothetical protein
VGQIFRTDAARLRAADSNESPKTKALLPASASVLVTRRAKPICRQLPPVRIAAATVTASNSGPHLWTVHGSSDVLKPTMAGHSLALTLQFLNLLFS